MTYVLYLDAYHLGDPLFLQGLARWVAQAGPQRPSLWLVHGSGERAERLLEAQGLFPERSGGVWAVTRPEERALVERALRETNRTIVATLTDAVVPAVGIHGIDRNLMRRQADGTVVVGRIGWVRDLARQRVVPVLSTLVTDAASGQPGEAAAGAVLRALAEAMRPEAMTAVALLKADTPGIRQEGKTLAEVPAEALAGGDWLPDPAPVEALAAAGVPVLLTNRRGLLAPDGPLGTRVC
ncbi:hypothetical protein AWN76_007100 [Rhodothermaceae bacterium RA]|nr:hypothetical protein AWN76_007100 [Rhodothermaceae bacterium RA]